MGTEFTDPLNAWYFGFGYGTQNAGLKTYYFNAWTVHDGDIAFVPEPGTLLLLASGLIGLAGLGREFKK